jgi:uncharacterized RmlC-like cupin family protein
MSDMAKMKYFIDPEEAPRFSQMEGLETTVLTGLSGERMMMALNATLPGHTLRIGDEERHARKGDFYCIPAGVPHGDTTIGDESFVMLDIFHPVREDFVEKAKN